MSISPEILRELSLLKLYELQVVHEFDEILASSVAELIGHDIKPIFVEIALKELWNSGLVEISSHVNSPGFRMYELSQYGMQKLQEDLNDSTTEIYHLNKSPEVQEIRGIKIPASDRIVKLNDNQVNELNDLTNDIINEISKKNIVGENADFQKLIIGQLKCAKELFNAGCFRVYVLEIAALESLRFIMHRYEKELVGGMAATLLAALARYFGIGA